MNGLYDVIWLALKGNRFKWGISAVFCFSTDNIRSVCKHLVHRYRSSQSDENRLCQYWNLNNLDLSLEYTDVQLS